MDDKAGRPETFATAASVLLLAKSPLKNRPDVNVLVLVCTLQYVYTYLLYSTYVVKR